MQITVFCNGDVTYDSAVTVTDPNPTAYDAIVVSGVAEGYDTSWGYYVTSMAGCGGSWGPAFYVNGAESSLGVSGYNIEDGDQLQSSGPMATAIWQASCILPGFRMEENGAIELHPHPASQTKRQLFE